MVEGLLRGPGVPWTALLDMGPAAFQRGVEVQTQVQRCRPGASLQCICGKQAH